MSDVDGSVYDLVRGAGDTLMREVAANTDGGTEFGANAVLTVSRVTLPASSTAGTIAGLDSPATILQLTIPAMILQEAGITEVNAEASSVSRGSDVVMGGERSLHRELSDPLKAPVFSFDRPGLLGCPEGPRHVTAVPLAGQPERSVAGHGDEESAAVLARARNVSAVVLGGPSIDASSSTDSERRAGRYPRRQSVSAASPCVATGLSGSMVRAF